MWTEVKHTAGIGINVKAHTLECLFAYSALGLAQFFGAQCNKFEGEPQRKTHAFHRISDSPEEALVRLLQEIHFLKEYENFNLIWPEISIPAWNKITGTFEIFARFHGYIGDTKGEDIKAITYHNLEILEAVNRYEVTVIFDV